MKRTYFFYFLAFSVSSLSVYNFLNNLESNACLEEINRKSSDVGAFIRQQRHRQRRNAEDDKRLKILFDFKIDKLARFLETTANKTVQEEFEKLLSELKKEIPTKCSCDHNPTDCQTGSHKQSASIMDGNHGDGQSKTSIDCLQGPRGPPGPIGPPGKPGYGIESPKLVNSALNLVANETDDVTFECVFFGNPIPSVEWESNVLSINNVPYTIDKEKAQITSRLTVKNVKWTSRGPIKCKARNSFGVATASGGLDILAKPVISLQEKLLFVARGINYQFPECKVRAHPKANVTWKRFFWSLPEGRHSTNNGLLKIKRVRYEDEGFYICEAENFLGKVEAKVQLKTNRLDMHEKPPPNLKGVIEVSITCSAYGNPSQMSGQITKIDGSEETTLRTRIRKRENLFIMKAIVEISGSYRCSIKFEGEAIKSYTNVQMVPLKTCKTIKKKNPSATSGSYLINLPNPTKVYCDMTTNGGGWIRIGRVQTTTIADVSNYNLNNVLSTNILDLNKAASQNYLLSGKSYPKLRSYVHFHEFRVFCTKPYHGRRNHASFNDHTTVKSSKYFGYLMGRYSSIGNTCHALKFMPDDNSNMRSNSCTSSSASSGPLESRFYKFIWFGDRRTIFLGLKYRLECDDYFSRTPGYNNFGTWLFYVR